MCLSPIPSSWPKRYRGVGALTFKHGSKQCCMDKYWLGLCSPRRVSPYRIMNVVGLLLCHKYTGVLKYHQLQTYHLMQIRICHFPQLGVSDRMWGSTMAYLWNTSCCMCINIQPIFTCWALNTPTTLLLSTKQERFGIEDLRLRPARYSRSSWSDCVWRRGRWKISKMEMTLKSSKNQNMDQKDRNSEELNILVYNYGVKPVQMTYFTYR